MNLNFILAQPSDMETLLEMMRELYVYDHSEFNADTHRAALLEMLDNPDCGRTWLISADDETVGYAVLTIGYSLEFHGHDGFLDELYVREAYRGQGLGTEAIAFVEEQARMLGIHALHLEVERANTRAQHVYESQGYKPHTRFLMTKWIL
jgi:GNAT superfamily N-acetyltransferase